MEKKNDENFQFPESTLFNMIDTNRYNDTEAAAGAWDLVQVSLSHGYVMPDWDGLRWIGMDV